MVSSLQHIDQLYVLVSSAHKTVHVPADRAVTALETQFNKQDEPSIKLTLTRTKFWNYAVSQYFLSTTTCNLSQLTITHQCIFEENQIQ